ncbi:hypothetical protein [Vibrio sp. MA40-2]
MKIKPNRRTRWHLENLANHSHCSMARIAMMLLKDYTNARNDA